MGYGTRSCTVLLIDRSGHVTFHEQDKNENPWGAVRDYINVRAHRTGCNDAMPGTGSVGSIFCYMLRVGHHHDFFHATHMIVYPRFHRRRDT